MPQVRVKGIGLIDIPPGSTREDVAEILARATGAQKPAAETSWMGHAKEMAKGIPAGLISGVAAIPEGIGAVTGDQGLKDIGQYLRNNDLTDYLAPNPGYEGSIPRQAGEIAGNLATMVGPSVGASAMRAPAMASRGIGALMGMLQGAAEQKREADRNRTAGMEVSPEDETTASRWGASTGLLDLLPVGRFLKPIERLGGMGGARELARMTKGEIVKDLAKTGLAEGVTESLQQGAQNLIEQLTYNPKQELGEGVVESGIAGGIAGGLLDGMIGGIARRIGRKGDAAAANLRERQRAPELKPIDVASVGIRSDDNGQAEIKYMDAISNAAFGRPMADLPPETQAVVAAHAGELKGAGISEDQAVAMTAAENLLADVNPSKISNSSPVESRETGKTPGPGMEVVQPERIDDAAPVAVDEPLLRKSEPEVEELPPPQEVNAPLSPEVAPPPGPVDAAADGPRQDPDTFLVPTKSLNLDPVRFQYKVEGIGRGGVGDELKGVQVWKPERAGVISVWKDPANGKDYVVNGHHRYDLAAGLNVPELRVQYIQAPDAQSARAAGALMNISEGRGTAIDAAKFMRDSGKTVADLEAEGISIKGQVAKEGAALVNLAPSLFDDVIHGNLNLKRAVIIGEGLTSYDDQKSVLRLAEANKATDAEIKEMIRLANARKGEVAPEVPGESKQKQRNLFGDEVEEESPRYIYETSQLSNFVRQRLSQEKKLFGMVGSESAAKRLGSAGNEIKAEANKEIADQANQALAVYDKLSGRSGSISDVLYDGARRIANGEKPADVKESIYTSVRDSVSQLLPKPANVSGVDAGAVEGGDGGVQANDGRERPVEPGLFSLSGRPAEPPPTKLSINSLRKQVEAGESPQIALDVLSEMRRLGIDDIVSTRLVDTLSTPNANGKYADQIITLALNSQDPKAMIETLNHEAVHAMKALGLFNDTEWAILKAALNPNAVLSDEERRRYRSIYGNDESLIHEEAVARGLERYAAGTLDLGGEAQRVAGQKIGMLDRLGSLFKSRGLDTAESVGQAFREGTVGRRVIAGSSAIAGNTEPAAIAGNETSIADLFGDTDEEGYAVETKPPAERLSIQQQPVTGRIFAEPDPRGTLRRQWDELRNPPKKKELKGKLRQQALDARAGIEALSREAGDLTKARTSAIAATRNADVSSDFATASLKHGALEYVGVAGNGYFRARENSPAPFGKNGFFTKAYKQGKLDRVLHYLAGSRAEKLLAEGREKLMTPAQIATYKGYGADPEVAAAARQWKIFNDQQLDVLVTSGRFDKATIDKWKDGDYLSFYRIDPDTGVVSQPTGGTLASAGKIVALKGSDQQIADPLENIVRNVNSITTMAMTNEARLRVARDGTQFGYMKSAVKGAPAKNQITVFVDGKPKKFEVTDQLLYDSVTASKIPINMAMKLAAIPGSFLRESVTLSPPFMIRNMLRDSMAVWAQGYTPAPFLNILGDAHTALSEGKSFQDLERLGVVGLGIRGEGGAAGTAENVRVEMDPRSRHNALQKALKFVEDKSRKSEATNRLTVYDAVMKRTGGDEAQAAYEARELLNFNRRGAHTIVQALTALIPFQNARWQGFDVAARSALGRGANPHMRRQLIARAAYMGAMTSIYTALISQLPAWKNATEEERENHWFVPTGNGEAIKVPIPFEFGFAAKVVPERLTAMMMGEEGGKELLHAFSRFAFSTMKVDIVPQGFAPAGEVIANYDRFRGREIESPWMKKLEKNYRADENTTELAKAIAPYTDYTPRPLSPVQVDHLLRGYLGTTAMYGANLIDFMIGPDPAGTAVDLKDRKMSQMPVIGTLFQREDGARKLIEFYAIRETAEQAAATLKAAHKARTPVDKADQARMAKSAQFERQTRKSDERMSMATKIERQVRSDVKAGRLTPAQGRQTLEELRKQKLAIAEPVIQLGKQQ